MRSLLILAVFALSACASQPLVPGERWKPPVHKVWSCKFIRTPCDAR